MKSKLALGLVQVGGKLSFYEDMQPQYYKDILRKAIRCGIRVFDSAYSYENADNLLYSVLKEQHVKREEYDITQKIMPLPTFIKKAETSLSRLNCDYFNTLLIHWPTKDERLLFSTFKSLEKLKTEEKCINIGVSNFPYELLKQVSSDFEVNVLERSYSLIWTKEIDKIIELSNEKNIKLYGYAPLGEGLLSGKYRDKSSLNDGRKNLWVFDHLSEFHSLLDMVEKLAIKYSTTMAEIALAFSRQGGFDRIFIGISKPYQLDIFSSTITLEEDEIITLKKLADKISSYNLTDNIYQHRW